MHIAMNSNPITAPAMSANMVGVASVAGGTGVVAVEGAENSDSVSFAPIEAVSISEAARRANEQPQKQLPEASTEVDNGNTETDVDHSQEPPETKQKQQAVDLAQIRQLKTRDAEVKAHEAAHAAVGGQLAGSPSYTYQRGPDGVRYAVAGEVPIDVSKVNGDPQATLEKMQRVQRAALAPAEPSPQDRRVAALAAQQAAEARAEISVEQRQQVAESEKTTSAEKDEKQSDSTYKENKTDKENQANEQANTQKHSSVAEIFAEQNARMRRINAFLLEISAPQAINAGKLINDVV